MRRVHSFIAGFIALSLSACMGSQTLQLRGSTQVPAAEGTVNLRSGENHNTRMDIVVRHLALPERVVAGGTVYVVWVKPLAEGSAPQNLGALRVNQKLEGELQTVTPLQAFDLWITAESAPTTQTPSGPPLISTRVNRPS